MDSITTTAHLKAQVLNFCEERDWNQLYNPKDLAIGISTEVGELLDLFRFKTEIQMKETMAYSEKREEISSELSDILFFVLGFAQLNGFDLSEELSRKIEINGKRYPVEEARGTNKKYTEFYSKS